MEILLAKKIAQVNESANRVTSDDNVLFFLNRRRELMVGNEEFSYPLNRVGAARHE